MVPDAQQSPEPTPSEGAPRRDFGPQPLEGLLAKHALRAHDLVAASTAQLTHKMVARAVKGRRLTPNVRGKVLAALNAAAGTTYVTGDVFSYE